MSNGEYIQHDPTWLYKVVGGKVEGEVYHGGDIKTAKSDGWKDTPGEAEASKQPAKKKEFKRKD